MQAKRPDTDEAERERLERLRGLERLKAMALGRALGKPWVPEGSDVPPPACQGTDDDDVLVAEDEEGMIGHPDPR